MDAIKANGSSIGMAIIDAVDDNGRLTQTPEEILAAFSKENPDIEDSESLIRLALKGMA